MDDAGAALRGVAADMGAGQAQIFAQELHQQRARIDLAPTRACRLPSWRHEPFHILLNQDSFIGRSPAGAAERRERLGRGGRRGTACGGGEIGEKFVGHVLGDAVHKTRAELGDLAADMRLDVIAQQRAAAASPSDTFAPPLAKPATPPSPSPEIV